jgi:hypothetical protein
LKKFHNAVGGTNYTMTKWRNTSRFSGQKQTNRWPNLFFACTS